MELQTGCASVDQEVSEYLARGCGCSKQKNGPCSSVLSSQEVTNYRLAISELDRLELDITLLAQLHAGMNTGELLTHTRGSARPGVRQRVTFTYMYRGRHICREMFIFLHRIRRTRLYNLSQHLCTNGLVPRIYGNKGKKPKHAFEFVDTTQSTHRPASTQTRLNCVQLAYDPDHDYRVPCYNWKCSYLRSSRQFQ